MLLVYVSRHMFVTRGGASPLRNDIVLFGNMVIMSSCHLTYRANEAAFATCANLLIGIETNELFALTSMVIVLVLKNLSIC